MATVHIPDEQRTLTESGEIRDYLAAIGIAYEQWKPSQQLSEGASAQAVLAAYAPEIERLKSTGGYVTADVIDVKPSTPNLEPMLAKFRREHWHDEDEVRFILEGSGVYFIHPRQGDVFAIEVGAGDLIRVPRGTWHWFDLCQEKRIRAIRLFQDTAGWTPHYTESGADRHYDPVCFGPSYLPSRF